MEERVGFINGGQQLISAYNATSEFVFESPIYKSGVGNGQTMIKVAIDQDVLAAYNETNGTSLELLPADTYTIENSEFQLTGDDANTTVRVRINIEKLGDIMGTQVQKYALPMKLIASGGVELNADKSEVVLIPEITGGARPNSAVTLFSKTIEEMGLSITNANSIAVTSKYVFVNSRLEDLRYYDRFTGEQAGTITLPFKGNTNNFAISNDDNDNLLITNWKNNAGAVQTIYRITGTGAPQKYIESRHTNVNGRRISITGNLDADAIITSTVENSSKVVYWTVKNGVLQSQDPQVYTADANSITWTNIADAVALDANLDNGMFAVGNGSKSALGYFDMGGATGALYDLGGGGLDPGSFANQALSYTEFNGVNYLALASLQSTVSMQATLLNVTNPLDLQLDPLSQKLLAYQAAPITTVNNANRTADVQLKVSDDGETMVLYSFVTNGSLVAIQFDKKATE